MMCARCVSPLDGDEQRLCYLLIRMAEGQQPQHLALAIRERVGFRARRRLGLGDRHLRTERWVNISIAPRHLP